MISGFNERSNTTDLGENETDTASDIEVRYATVSFVDTYRARTGYEIRL